MLRPWTLARKNSFGIFWRLWLIGRKKRCEMRRQSLAIFELRQVFAHHANYYDT